MSSKSTSSLSSKSRKKRGNAELRRSSSNASIKSSEGSISEANDNESQQLVPVPPVPVVILPLPSGWNESVAWPFGDFVYSVACSPDGLRVAHGGRFFIHLRSIVHKYKAHVIIPNVSKKSVDTLCYSPDGTRLAAGTADNAVKVYDAVSGDPVYVVNVDEYVKHVLYTPDGSKLLASVGALRYVIIDAASGSILSTHNIEAVRGICLSANGRKLFLGGMGKITVVDDLTRLNLRIDCKDIRRICVSADGSRIIVGLKSGDFAEIDPVSALTVRSWKGHTKDPCFLSMNADRRVFVSGSEDRTIKVWDASTLECMQTLEGHTHYVYSVCFGRNNCVVSGSNDKTVRVWEPVEPDTN